MAQQRPDDMPGGEAESAASLAKRMSEATRSGTQTEAEALRDGGQVIGRTLQESAQAAQRSMEAGGQTARRSLESVGQGAQHLAEAGADQFERLGDMMADTLRDAAESARLMVSFSTFTNEGLRGMQQAASSLLERIVQTNIRAMQELVQQANMGGMASWQQRFIREYLQAMTQGSAEMVRAAQQLANEAVRPLEQAQASEAERGRRRRPQRAPRIGEVMTREVRKVRPDATVQEAAQLMSRENTGVLPVADNGRVLGVITDRDIAIRLVGGAKDPAKTRVRDIMSDEVEYCYEDEEIEHVAELMAEQQLRRLPVMDRRQHLVGIVSIGDLAERQSPETAGQTLAGIARDTGQHSQRLRARRR
ncbi:CBS domain-containing protein [Azospirillum sp. sgz302134]